MTLATTKACVYRATKTSPAGDLEDDNTTPVVGLESFPIAITEKSRRVYDFASDTQRTIRYSVGRPSNPSLNILKNDRIKDLTTGRIYPVDEATYLGRTIAGGASLILDLRHV
jgi:hypothetical protein